MRIGKYIDGLYGIDTNINLSILKNSTNKIYDIIKEHFQNDQSDYSGQSTLSTQLFTKYNFLLYPLPGIHDLYWQIHHAFHKCLVDHYRNKPNGKSIIEDKYVIGCWLNYYKKGEFIDWHGHSPRNYNSWHGFFCLDTEPDSYTSYRWQQDPNRKDLILDVQSKDGMIVLGLSNMDQHRSSEWHDDSRPRITIAFDITPLWAITEIAIREFPEPKYLNAMKHNPLFTNHWIPI